jgi:hypothetical protein
VIVVAFARVAGSAMRARGFPALPTLLMVKICFLLAFFVLAVAFWPFADSDAPTALLAGFAGVTTHQSFAPGLEECCATLFGSLLGAVRRLFCIFVDLWCLIVPVAAVATTAILHHED